MSKVRIALAGGGTGGHIFPLVAVVRSMKQLGQGIDFRFIGPVPFGQEKLKAEGITVVPIIAGKIPRYATPKLFLEMFKIPIGFFMAFWHMFSYMPDIVFGKGGYGMLPVAFVAWLFRIPVIIHESDAIAGLATRIASRFATVVLTSFPETHGVHGTTQCVGNPIRHELLTGNLAEGQQRFKLAMKPTILVLGGSQGAEEINALMLRIAPEVVREAEVIHQVGQAHEEVFTKEMHSVLEPYPGSEAFYRALGFLDEMTLRDAYAVATVVVARAGASQIFELAALGKPTIFVPHTKGSAQQHQYANAEAIAGEGGAILLSGKDLTPNLLLDQIKWLLNDANKRNELSQKILEFARPDAADMIARVVLDSAQHRSAKRAM